MKIALPLICLLLVACSNPASNTSSKITKEETEIAKNLVQGAFDDLWGGLDSTKILRYHTEDFVILENGEVWDNDRIIQYMRERSDGSEKTKRVNFMDYFSIEKYGSSIQMAYNNRAEFYRNDSLTGEGSWLESALAVKTADGWRLKMMHSTWNKK